jgi:hypothetical protein
MGLRVRRCRRSASVVRVDPSTHEVVAAISLDERWIRDVAALDGHVLVQSLGDSTVLTVIDPTTDEVVARRTTDQVADPFVEGDGQVWAGATSGSVCCDSLARIDAATSDVIGEPIRVGEAVRGTSLAMGEGGIWFEEYDPSNAREPGTIDRLNLATGRVDVSLPKPPHTSLGMAVSPGSLWMLADNGTVVRLALD